MFGRMFLYNGVIEIIFLDWILAKFKKSEDDDSSTTSLMYTYLNEVDIYLFGVGYWFIYSEGNARSLI